MAEFSAADLQKQHLEGAPDPFPSLGDKPAKSHANGHATPTLDVTSDQAFPSLAPVTAAKPASATWGSGAAPRIKAAGPTHPMAAETFTMTAIDLSTGREGKPATLGDIMKQVMAKYKVKVEASTNQKTKQTTFALRAESHKELEKAKRNLLSLLSPVVTTVINAPASTIPALIGPKGATMKHIRDQTGVKIDVPRRDGLAPPVNGTRSDSRASGAASSAVDEDEEDEPTIPVTISGPQPMVYEAQEMIDRIISSRTSTITRRVRDIPIHVLPFLVVRRSSFISAAQGADVNLALNAEQREITVSGDRTGVTRVVESIKGLIDAILKDVTNLKFSLPKRQHRLLIGQAIDDIVTKSRCSVVVPAHDDPSDEVVVWGKADDLPNGLQAVMQAANSQYIHEYPLPGPAELSLQLATYMAHIDFPKTLSATRQGVAVYLPHSVGSEQPKSFNIEVVGDKPVVDAAVADISKLMAKLIGGMKNVQIDWVIHRILQGTKNTKKLKQLHDSHNVRVLFPPETAESSTVLLVYDPDTPSATSNYGDKSKHLQTVEKELQKLAKEAADVKSELIPVDSKWHDAVIGRGGTTLNAIIGEEKTVIIKVGKEAGHMDSVDYILVRGESSEVDRAANDIRKIVEDAKNDEIEGSHSTEFDIPREYVARIVGAGGSGVNRIREQLGVNVDFSDDGDDKDGKKKKVTTQKTHVKIIGRKANAEEAKKRILAQVDRLADETTEILKIPSQYHSSLIGQNGKYAVRLEEKYSVKITFPRQGGESGEGRTREPLKSDEVLIKGGKKGVAAAKAELLDALEYEKEANNIIKFTVPTRSVARILGRGGVTINEIKDNTGAQIDIEKGSDETTSISIRGSKKDVAEAKAAILAISDSVGEEVTEVVHIDSKLHRGIIGAGGQGLRDLITRCGGPADTKLQAGLVRFPRQEESSDEVRLRGDPKVVAKLKAELEKMSTAIKDRVVLGVVVPAAQHRALIGRGGQHLNDLQNRTGAQVQFPGSHSYHQMGEVANPDDVNEADPADLVKVTGPRAACEKAVEELKDSIKVAKPPQPELTTTISVPLKYHHFISQQGNFFRSLRSFGVHVENPVVPQKPAVPLRPTPDGGSSARIDDDGEGSPAAEAQWEVISNYQDAEEGDSEWTLKSRDQASLDKAKQRVEQAIENAAKMSHVGFLVMPDRSSFPRIVGAKGANVARLRDSTGADITVSREDNTITIIGTESALEVAKEEVLKAAAARRPARRDE